MSEENVGGGLVALFQQCGRHLTGAGIAHLDRDAGKQFEFFKYGFYERLATPRVDGQGLWICQGLFDFDDDLLFDDDGFLDLYDFLHFNNPVNFHHDRCCGLLDLNDLLDFYNDRSSSGR